MATLNARGHEILDSRPVEVPLKLRKPKSMEDRIRDAVREEFSARASEQGFETFEEADDFDVGDDFDPTSPYELDFDQETYSAPKTPVKTPVEQIQEGPIAIRPTPAEPKPAEPATP